MILKIENQASQKLPKDLEQTVDGILNVVPREHLRGLTRVVFVDRINLDARMAALAPTTTDLPGVYHPKQGNQAPWLEISAGTLLTGDGYLKRMAAKAGFKANLASVLYMLIAQHHHLTLSYGVKRGQMEGKVRSYVDKHHNLWRETQTNWRSNLLKPFRPQIERMAKWLKKRYDAEQAKTARS